MKQRCSEDTEDIAGKVAANVDDTSVDVESTGIPHPPWHLRGAAVVLPYGVLGVLALVHYETSPVGPYDELAVIRLTRRGPSVVEMCVNSTASMIGGRRGWGYPKQLGRLQWQRQDQRVLFRAGRRQWLVSPWGIAFPVRLRAWTAQLLNGTSVRAPVRVAGRARLAWNGRRVALLMESLEMTVFPPQRVG
jgi:hypothetical protein